MTARRSDHDHLSRWQDYRYQSALLENDSYARAELDRPLTQEQVICHRLKRIIERLYQTDL